MRVLLAAAAMLIAVPALAADVTVPWGDWLAGALVSVRDAVIALVVALIGVLAKQLSPAIRDVLHTAKVEQLLSRAADYGIVAVAGAVKGKTMDVKIANEVIAEAMNYAVANAPELAARLGNNLRPKIVARLAPYLPAEADAKALKAEVTPYP
jgi:hypothetical protein